MHTCIRTRCCDLHTSARTSASEGSAFHRPLFSCCGEKEREGQRIRPVPLSRLVSNSSSPSRQACAGLWLGSPAARLGLWNNRRPPRRLGGVCEPRLRTGARLAEWCVLANTQLVCLPHANGPAFTTAHAIGSRRPDEHQAGLNKRPPPLFHDPLFLCLPSPRNHSSLFSALVARTHASLRFPLTPDVSSCRSLIFSLAFCEQLAPVPERSSFTPESPVRTDRERVSRRSVLPNGKSSRFLAWCCAGVCCGSRWTQLLTEIKKENVKIGTSRTECSRKPG